MTDIFRHSCKTSNNKTSVFFSPLLSLLACAVWLLHDRDYMEIMQCFPWWSTSVSHHKDTTDTIVQKWAWQQRQEHTCRGQQMHTDSIAEINCLMQTWSDSLHPNDLYCFSRSFNFLWRESTGVVTHTHTPTNSLKTHSSDCSARGSAQNSIKRSGASQSLSDRLHVQTCLL